MKNLGTQLNFRVCSGPVVAGTADVEGSIIDTNGFRAYMLVAKLGDVTSGSKVKLKAQGGSANSSGAMADLSGRATSEYTAGASDADSKFIILDVALATTRYIRPVLSRTTQNAVVEGLFCILYDPILAPCDNSADELMKATSA